MVKTPAAETIQHTIQKTTCETIETTTYEIIEKTPSASPTRRYNGKYRCTKKKVMNDFNSKHMVVNDF